MNLSRRILIAAVAASWLVTGCSNGDSRNATPTAPSLNRAPQAYDDTVVQKRTSQPIAVLRNDTDPDGDSLAVKHTSSPANGSVALNDNGTPADASDDYLDYTPAAGYRGRDSFTYTISDPAGLSSTATVHVRAMDSAPVAKYDSAQTPPGAPVSIFVLANDTDPNGLPLSLASVSAPANGTATISDNGTPADPTDDYISYQPLPAFTGTDIFSYEASNGDETVAAFVNVNVGGSGSATVGGDVTKGPIAGAAIRLYRIDGAGLPTGAAVAGTITDAKGQWTASAPLPREPLLVVASGGRYHDDTDGNPDPDLRRVITLAPTDQLEGVLPAADSYLSLNLYTNALLLKSRVETRAGEFGAVYANNRGLLTNAMGFDPVTTAPTDPGDPDTAAGAVSLQYALMLGGATNVVNGVIQSSGQHTVTFNVLRAFIEDMQDCRLDGVNQAGAVRFRVLGVQRNMPGAVDLNAEITRFRNNNFTRYAGITAFVDESVCSQSGAVPDTTPPALTLLGSNPLTLEGGGAYVDAGATASDDRDGDLTGGISVTGSVDPLVVGSYTLSYTVADGSGNTATAMRRVDVVDTTAPLLTLNGSNPVVLLVDNPYVDAGATAIDLVDGDISARVAVVNPVDVTTPGSYTITYQVSDAAGNAATPIARSVTVVDTANPVISIVGGNPLTVEAGTAYVDPGATAVDAIDGDLSASIVAVSNVDTSVIGAYTVTYDVSDSSGNPAAQQVRVVNVADTIAPSIVLAGSNPQIIEAPGAYLEQGASASDSFEGDLSTSIVIDASAVDTSVPASYLVTYDVGDSSGNVAPTVTRTVTVQDTTAPVIALTGANPQSLVVDTPYTELGASASDSLDGDLSGSIVIDTTGVDPSTPGTYSVTYDVADAAGNAAIRQVRTVNVVPNSVPVVTLAGANPQFIEAGSAYTELGATASDTEDGDLTAAIVMDASAVDTLSPGSYPVTYDVTDSDSNAAAQVVRTVTVQDTTAPVVSLVGAASLGHEAGTPYTDAGASASDTLDGDISAAIVTGGAVNVSVPGVYVLTYDVSDAAGNAATQVTRTVTVADTVAPVITLTGPDPLMHEAGVAFSDPGATASDSFDGDVSGSLVTGGSVDTNVVGDYVLTYDVSDSSGNAATQVTRTVQVRDTVAPLIALTGADPLVHEAGTAFTDPGATATDSFDGDVSGSIVTGGSVDANVIGDYVLTYDVSDGAGNAATQVTRTVQVRDTVAPVLTLTGADPLMHEAGVAFSDPGATASDSFDGDVSGSIVTGGSVDANVIGDYVLTYDVSDGAGNAATQVTRTVQVRDTLAPVITLTAADPLPHEAGTAFSDPGATASDSFEGDVSGSIVTGGSVDANVIGDYVLTYDVSDGSGNAATQVTRTVQVRDTAPPVITLVGANPDVVAEGSGPYADPGATANDVFEGDLTASILVTGSVDTTTAGTYVLSYDVSDSGGNAADTLARTVEVVPLAETQDSDGDGLSDAIEQAITGNPTATQANTFFIDPDPSIVTRDGTSWATAYAGIEDVVAANGGFVPKGTSAAQPTYLVLGDTSAVPATAGNPDLYQIVLVNGDCSDIAVIGSMADGQLHPATGLTEPNTLLNAPNARVLNATNCNNLQFHQVQFVDSGGPAVVDGGAFRLATGYAIFDHVFFRRNEATVEGGALRLGNSFAPTIVRDSVFEDNFVSGGAGLGGGAILLDNNAQMDISNTVFVDNSTLTNGGALYAVQNADLDITAGYFAGNAAGLDGGALVLLRNNVSPANEIAHNVFSGNRAGREGGAIYNNCNEFVPPLRVFNNLVSGNSALRGGAFAIDDCEATPYDGNTVVLNEATAASGGGAFHVDTVSLAAPNFRPMPEIVDNIIYGNIDGGGISAYSINNLPAWGQNDSHENLIDDALSATTKDTMIGDPALEFEVAWYLQQATSSAIDLSQVNAANVNKFQATPEKTTDRYGAVDAAKADAGYHYPGLYPGDVISVSTASSLQGNGGTAGQPIVVTLRDGLGLPVGSGYRISLEIGAGSAPVNVQPVSTAPDPLAPPGASVATDLGNGRYRLLVDTDGVPGPDSVTLNVYADGVLVGQPTIPVNP